MHLQQSDWQGYVTVGYYTAVQPEEYRQFLYNDNPYIFPTGLRSLPRVTKIDSCIEQAEIPDGVFDEVFSKDVISDPGTEIRQILKHAARVTKVGGLITFLAISTPDEAPTINKLSDFYEGVCSLVCSGIFTHDDFVEDSFISLDPNWVAALSPYSRYIRTLGTEASFWRGSFFAQFRKD